MTLLEHLVHDKLTDHPLPWSIDYDWLVEVWDSAEPPKLVTKVHSDPLARELVSTAERLDREMRELREGIEAQLAEGDA